MIRPSPRFTVLASAGLLAVAVAAALGTPGTGVSGRVLARGTSPVGIAVSRPGATEVTVREIAIAPGGSTGWHYHDGPVIAVVKSGILTRTLHDCTSETTPAGSAFVEPAGPDQVHVGRNLGTEPVVLLVTYVLPAGQALAQDAPAAPCSP